MATITSNKIARFNASQELVSASIDTSDVFTGSVAANYVPVRGAVNNVFANSGMYLSGSILRVGGGTELAVDGGHTFYKYGTTNGYYTTIEGGTATASGYVNFWANSLSRGYIGNATTTNMFIVAQNGANLALQTAGSTRMTIDTDGNVGIGTVAPKASLHIYKQGGGVGNTIQGEIRVCSDDNQISRIGCYEESNGTTWGGFFQYNGASTGGLNDMIQIGGKTSGVDQYYISIQRTNGHVGIGTIAPVSALTISNASTGLVILNNSTNSATRSISGGVVSNEICGLSSMVANGGGTDAGQLRLSAGGGTNASTKAYIDLYGFDSHFISFGTRGTERMRITNDGNIVMNSYNNNIPSCTGINMPTVGYGLTWGLGYSRIFDDGDLRICTDDNLHIHTGCTPTTTGTERITITHPNGFTGFGTVTPDAPLHIYSAISRSYTNASSLDVQFAMTNIHGGKWYLGQNQSPNSNLYLIANVASNFNTLDVCALIENDIAGARLMNFTGQHRCSYDSSINETTSEGLIVRATGTYWSLIDSFDNTSQIDHITINESLPQITLVKEVNCTSVFGVVSFTEDPEQTRKNRAGRFTSIYTNPRGEKKRVYVNSLGEGAVWVCNVNGAFTCGDLITTSSIPGYGMRQDSHQIMNYTLGKITMNCDFQPSQLPVQTILTRQELTTELLFEDQVKEETTTKIEYDNELKRYIRKTVVTQRTERVAVNDTFPLYNDIGIEIGTHVVQRTISTMNTVNDTDANGNIQWINAVDSNGNEIMKPAYQIRYIQADGMIITHEQYQTLLQNGQPVYIAAFVGCTYNAG
jgi:hypothetical protein